MRYHVTLAWLRSLLLKSEDSATILGGAGIALAIRLLASVVGYASIILLTQWMGPSEFGRYSIGLAWMMLLAYPATMGLPGAALRFVPQYRATEDWPKIIGFIKASSFITLGCGGAVALIGIVSVLLLKAHLGDSYAAPMIMALAGVPIVALSLTSAEVARAFGWLWLAWAPLQIAQPPLLLLMIAVAMLIVGDLSATVALGVGILAHATVLVVQWGILRARIASKISVEPSMDVRLWVHVALPFVWITAATLVLAQGGVIIIGFFVTPADVATYKIAAATSLLVGILLQASTALSAPKFASLHAQTRSSDLEVLFTSVIRWTFWPSLAIAFMLIAFRSPILRLFGLDSDNARWVLSILALGQLANTTAGPVTHLLAMTGHQLLTARVTGCSAVLYLLLALVATALWGTIGAALALVAASLFWNFWLAVLVVRKLKFHPGTFLQRYRQSER